MKTSVLIFIGLWGMMGWAQTGPVLNERNWADLDYNTLIMGIGVPLDTSQKGPNQYWDFSLIQMHPSHFQIQPKLVGGRVYDCETNFQPYFSLPNFCFYSNDASRMFLYALDEYNLRQLARIEFSNGPGDKHETINFEFLQTWSTMEVLDFPLFYQKQWTASGEAAVLYGPIGQWDPWNLKDHYDHYSEAEIDAYGTLILPQDTFEQSIRLHKRDSTIQIWQQSNGVIDSVIFLFERFQWFSAELSNNSLSGLLEMEFGIYQHNHDPPVSFQGIYYDSLITAPPVSIEKEKDASFQLYPNPFSDEFRIAFKDEAYLGSRLEIRDLTGRLLWQQGLSAATTLILPYTLAGGLYVVRLVNSKGQAFDQKLWRLN